MIADVTKKVLLHWPNKVEETVPQMRPDAIVSTFIQLKFDTSLGYGEVKPGDDSIIIQSLCVDTMKLAVLSRNAAQKCDHPIISFQVNGKIHQREDNVSGVRMFNDKFVYSL